MEVPDYRKRYEAQLAKAARTKPRRRGAAGKLTAAQRASAIRDAPLDEEQLPERVTELLANLLDEKESLTVREAALQALSALDFLGPRFAPYRADYLQALRQVATDPKEKLRERALELLAIEKDPYVQELLVRGLKRPKEALLPEAKAIQLLGYDDHTAVLPVVRQVFKRAKGPTREEALRLLATDPSSERLFARLLKDRSETRSIRLLSVAGLQSLNPVSFERAARGIVADEDDDDAIRAATLAALAHGREAREKPADPKLVDLAQKVGETTRSTSVRAAARRFVQSAER
jgi:hypothetical protein